MKYIKLFKNHSDYEAFKLSEDFVTPNISYCILELEVHYNPVPIPVLGEVQVFHDKWCTEYAHGDENTVYVRLNRAFNVGQSKSWIGENGDLVVQTPDSLPAEDPFAVIVWANLYSEGLAEPFSEGDVVECTSPDGGHISSGSPTVIFYADGTSSTAPQTASQSLVVKYNVENEGDPIMLFYNQGGSGSGSGSGSGGEVPFSSMEIDGVELSEVVSLYTFSTTGEHTVKYTLADPTSIGASAFNGCDKLTSIDIPNDVTSIGNQAFYQCTSLTSINIPNSVTSIGDSAFCECSGLTSVTIGSGVTSISYCAFQGCSSLTSVTIPNSVTSIGTYAFDNCSSLTSINIPDSVTSIGQYAFEDCTSLTSITMGSGVTSIDDYVFYNCRSLTSIASNATSAPTIYSSTFQSVNTGGTLTVPSGSSGYDTWMQKTNYYLGLYNWTKVEQ